VTRQIPLARKTRVQGLCREDSFAEECSEKGSEGSKKFSEGISLQNSHHQMKVIAHHDRLHILGFATNGGN
jgi:hypothetical protein